MANANANASASAGGCGRSRFHSDSRRPPPLHHHALQRTHTLCKLSPHKQRKAMSLKKTDKSPVGRDKLSTLEYQNLT